jgi:creatinine amidohydrolase
MTFPKDPYSMADLSADEIGEYLRNDDTILIPMASLEQHGPHLPLATDSITAYEVARRAARQAKVLYTPTVWHGYSPQHLREPLRGSGSITLRADTLLALLYDIGRSLVHHGFRRLIFVNGHGSNAKVVDPLLRRLRYDTGAIVVFYKPYAERYLGMLTDILENPPEEMPGWHSSELETSQVMAFDETLVDTSRMAPTEVRAPSWLPPAFSKSDGAPDIEFEGYQYFVMPFDHQEFSPTGVIGNPMRATKEKGEIAFQRFADHLERAIAELRKAEVQIREEAIEWRERA